MNKFGGLGSGLSSIGLGDIARSGEDLAQGVQTKLGDVQGVFQKGQSLLSNPLSQLGSGFNVSGVNDLVKGMSKSVPSLKVPEISLDGKGGTAAGQIPGEAADLRVRLRAQPKQLKQVYGAQGATNILSPLYDTNGMMFPFTPTIDWAQQVEYTATSLTHSNQDYYSYKNTPSTKINVTGDFVIQNQQEGEYMLAVIHFLRTVSKMYFGKQSFTHPNAGAGNEDAPPSLAGMPPPVLLFSGYGNFMFNDLPVIVQDHRYALKPDVHYLDIAVAGGIARLPSTLTVSVSLVVQNPPKKHRDEFDLDKFRTGELMKNKNKGWI